MAPKPKPFRPSRAAEAQFARALKKVGRVSGHLVEAHVDGHKIQDEPGMMAALKAYAKILDPWARKQSAKMLEQVSKSNRRAYSIKSKQMGKALQHQVMESGIGDVVRGLMREQVELITTIPLRAGIRAQKLAVAAVMEGTRASEVAAELMRSTNVSESNALRIARTEVARANASITKARAQSIGATAYIWRTTMDGAERDSHGKMNGKYVEYSKEPTLSDGTKGHAGTFPNCRCYQDVQFDDQ